MGGEGSLIFREYLPGDVRMPEMELLLRERQDLFNRLHGLELALEREAELSRHWKERLHNVESSATYKFGRLLSHCAASPSGWLQLPLELGRFAFHRLVRRASGEPLLQRGSLLRQASDIALSGSYPDALAFLDTQKSPETRFTRHLVQANASLHDDAAWLSGLNAYLAQFQLSPIALQPGERDRFLRLSARQAPAVTDGPRVSVIMTAFNAVDTLTHAVLSVLEQTWRNLELIVVDDASTDGTWAMLQTLSAADPRMKLVRSRVNAGPYVGRNHALSIATGDFITCHDADDWAHPQRIERQMASLTSKRGAKATWCSMLRLHRDGHFPGFGQISGWSFDGAARLASVSALFEKRWFDLNLGHWDSVRFAADSELIGRARLLLGNKFRTDRVISMLCLSSNTSLTGAAQTGLRSAVRTQYRAGWQKWHSTLQPGDAYVAFPQTQRKFEAPVSMLVDQVGIHPAE